jgi:hypothetical protein
LPRRNVAISDFVSCSESDETLRFFGGERRGVDLKDFSDRIAMSPLQ